MCGRASRRRPTRTATSGATRSSISPTAAAGDVLVLVEVTLDADGTVRLSASELVTGERLQLEQIFHAGLARSDVARLARQFAEAP